MLTLEQCLNKKVRCSDGGYRRLRNITERTLHYEVPIGGGGWFSMGGTPRHEVEELFHNGIIVDEVPDQKSL